MAFRNGRIISWGRLIGLLMLAALQDMRAERNGGKGCSLLKKPLRITTWSFPPYVIVEKNSYAGISFEFFRDVMNKCYKNCSSDPQFTVTLLNSETEFQSAVKNNDTDIGFPIARALKLKLGDELDDELDFQPVTISRSLLFIIDVDNYNERILKSALKSLIDNSWPMILLILLLGGIAGIVVWVLDSSENKDHFPRTFIKGSYEGCWWAFVSMTTVGYGDKTPKSVCARVFGVLWILLGLVVIAMFTATATNAITSSSSTGSGLQGYKVAVLNNTEARVHCSRYGAEVHANYSTFDAMSRDLKKGKVDGMLMDSFIASYFLKQLNDTYDFKVLEMFEHTITYYIGRINHVALQMDKDNEDRDSCFGKRLKELATDMLEEKHLTAVKAFRKASERQGILNANSPATRTVLLILTAVLLGLIICGCTGEACYRKSRHKTRNPDKGERNAVTQDERCTEIAMQEMNEKPLQEMDQKLAAMMEEMQSLRDQIKKITNGSGQGDQTRL